MTDNKRMTMTRDQLEAMTDAELSETVAGMMGLPFLVEHVDGYTVDAVPIPSHNYVADYRPVLDAIRGRGMYADVGVRRTGKFSAIVISGDIKRQVEGLGVDDNIGRAVCVAAVLACRGES
jgi:hypothetical protein